MCVCLTGTFVIKNLCHTKPTVVHAYGLQKICNREPMSHRCLVTQNLCHSDPMKCAKAKGYAITCIRKLQNLE